MTCLCQYNDTADGPYNIFTGKDDISKVSLINSWRESRWLVLCVSLWKQKSKWFWDGTFSTVDFLFSMWLFMVTVHFISSQSHGNLLCFPNQSRGYAYVFPTNHVDMPMSSQPITWICLRLPNQSPGYACLPNMPYVVYYMSILRAIFGIFSMANNHSCIFLTAFFHSGRTHIVIWSMARVRKTRWITFFSFVPDQYVRCATINLAISALL